MFPKTTKILLAEDAAITRTVLETMLSKLGFLNITPVVDGFAAELEIRKYLSAGTPYGLVIADWNMPRLTGIELLKKVRADPRTRPLPFLLLTSNNEKAQVLEAIQAGVTGYLAKPVSLETLERKLAETWESLRPKAA